MKGLPYLLKKLWIIAIPRCQNYVLELSISGVEGRGTIPQLITSAKGEGGMKVVLKPRAENEDIAIIK